MWVACSIACALWDVPFLPTLHMMSSPLTAPLSTSPLILAQLYCLQEQATTLHVMGMLDYAQLKGRLLSTTAGLVLAGSCIAFSSGGAGAAAPFAVGGSAGMAYLWLLQQSVDSLPGTMPATSASRFDKVSAALLLHCIGETVPHEQARCLPSSSPLADVMTYVPACSCCPAALHPDSHPVSHASATTGHLLWVIGKTALCAAYRC